MDRGMAQSGSASALGAEGRRFESCCPDQLKQRLNGWHPVLLLDAFWGGTPAHHRESGQNSGRLPELAGPGDEP
jgi:hypothetical protein